MSSVFRSTRCGPTSWARRVALLALIALQMAVAISPLLEPHHEATASHVEQTGATHHFLVHDESTCAVCLLRTVRQLPATASAALPASAPAFAIDARAHLLAASRDTRAHSPRAPPVAA